MCLQDFRYVFLGTVGEDKCNKSFDVRCRGMEQDDSVSYLFAFNEGGLNLGDFDTESV
jgi:hypothetical protein